MIWPHGIYPLALMCFASPFSLLTPTPTLPRSLRSFPCSIRLLLQETERESRDRLFYSLPGLLGAERFWAWKTERVGEREKTETKRDSERMFEEPWLDSKEEWMDRRKRLGKNRIQRLFKRQGSLSFFHIFVLAFYQSNFLMLVHIKNI